MKTIACAALLVASTAWSADTQLDQEFWYKAAEANTGEVELGELAQAKGMSSAVKEFGGMMIKDHSVAKEKLRSITSKKQVELPAKAGATQIAAKAKLQTLMGDDFDKEYIRTALSDHEGAIQLFEQEAQSGLDPDLKSFAASTLPTLRAHLQAAQALAKKRHVKTAP